MVKIKTLEEEPQVESHWDMKRVGVAGVILLIIAASGLYAGYTILKSPIISQATLGVSSENTQAEKEVSLPKQEDVQNIITSAQESLSHITADNVTASGAAIQKVISDLQNIQGGKSGVTDTFCNLVCKDK